MCDVTALVIKANNYTPLAYTHARSYPTNKWPLERESKKDEDELLLERSRVTMDHSHRVDSSQGTETCHLMSRNIYYRDLSTNVSNQYFIRYPHKTL